MASTSNPAPPLRKRSTLVLMSNSSVRKSSRTNALKSVRAATEKLKPSKSSVNGFHNDLSGTKRTQTFNGNQTSKPTDKESTTKLSSMSKKLSGAVDKPKEKELWFPKGSHVAVYTDRDPKFYLCRLLQNTFNSTKDVKVRWLSSASVRFYPNIYRTSYLDKIDPASILLQVGLFQKSRLRYLLPDHEEKNIFKMIRLVEDVQSGTVAAQDIEEEDVYEVVQIEEPPKKKPKLVKTKSQLHNAKGLKNQAKRAKSTPKKAKTAKQPREKQDKRKIPKKVDELKLNPRPEIKVLDKDPLFETKLHMPYVSKVSNSRLIFRAINLGDVQMLKKLLKDGHLIRDLYTKSPDHAQTPVEAAVKTKNKEILNVLLTECMTDKFSKRMKDNPSDTVYLHKLETGSYDRKSLGIAFIRKIQASRGSKEGNNAFTKMNKRQKINCWREAIDTMLLQDLDPTLYQEFVQDIKKKSIPVSLELLERNTIPLLLKGKNRLAGEIFKKMKFRHVCDAFNLIRDVLLNKDEELKSCPPSHVKHYVKSLANITPVHCAACNPNDKYLKKLLSVEPSVHVTDRNGRKPIHFAACCNSSGNLEFLLQKGASIADTDNGLKIPLHYAIRARRVDNVKLLLEKAKSGAVSDPWVDRYGIGGVNRPAKDSLNPLHMAVEMEELDIARILLSYGASVNSKTSISDMQRSPIQLAAQTGNLDMVKLLVDHGAVVEQKDRLGRTAVILACKNGATKVLSYLVHIGANPERTDSSDNTPIHYAAAYGWYFTLKFLLEMGVDSNATNMWMITPLSVAYMKGHVGIFRELLNFGKTNINQALGDGSTLLFHACESDLTQEDLHSQIKYLVEEKGAMCDIKDVDGKTALFYLAKATVHKSEKMQEGFEQSVKIAQLLLDNGCDLDATDEDGCTALMNVLEKISNIPLAEFLDAKGCKILMESQVRKSTLLHEICVNLVKTRTGLPKVLKILQQSKHLKATREMAKTYDLKGYSPLLKLCCNIISVRSGHEMYENQTSSLAYMKFLVDTLGTKVNDFVWKKSFAMNYHSRPKSEADHYHNIHQAKCTPLLLLTYFQDDWNDKSMDTEKESITIKMIKYLVGKGADVNAVSFNGATPLTTCLQKDCLNLMRYLGSKKDCKVNQDIIFGKQTAKTHPLFIAKNKEQIFALIDIGCDVNIIPNEEQPATFLHTLLLQNKMERYDILDIVEKIETSKQTFNFNAQDWKGRNVLHHAIRGNPALLDTSLELEYKLIQLGSKPGLQDVKMRTPLHYLFKRNSKSRFGGKTNDPVKLVQMISKTMTEKEINFKDCNGKTALHMAAEVGATISCILLLNLKDRKADLSLCDSSENTPLTLAVLNGHDQCGVALIQAEANMKDAVVELSDEEKKRRKIARKQDISSDQTHMEANDNSKNDDTCKQYVIDFTKYLQKEIPVQKTPMFKVALQKKLQGVTMLLSQADRAKSGLTALKILKLSFEACHYNISMELLLNEWNVMSMEERDEYGRNLLHQLAISCKNYNNLQDPLISNVALFLIKKKIPVEQKDAYLFDPIHYAIMNRNFNLANLLAAHGTSFDADPNGKQVHYMEAALWRIHSKKFDNFTWAFLKNLIDKGMDIDHHLKLPLYPELANHCEQKNKIVDPHLSERKSARPTTALIASITCTTFKTKRASELLKCGADSNVSDGDQVTPMMHAVKQNDKDYIKLLLNHDYPDIKDDAKPPVAKTRKHVNTSIFRLKPSTSTSSDSSQSENSDDDSSEDDQMENEKPAEEEFKTVKKTSKVNLDARDMHGRTCLHYVASPTPDGTFDNAEIAYILVSAGAKELKDKSGQTPYALAVKFGAHRVASLLKLHGHGKQDKYKPQNNREFLVNDGIHFENESIPDFETDGTILSKDCEMDVDEQYIHEIDEECTIENGTLLKDEELDVWYDVILTMVNVPKSIYKSQIYKFYKIQLIHQSTPSLYILFTSWGYIGDTGQHQHTPFTDLAAGVKEFCKIFRQKTGNHWKDMKSFEMKPNKYRLLDDSARQAPPTSKTPEIILDSDVTSALPNHLYLILKKMMEPEQLVDLMANVRKCNFDSLPFGFLKKERLLKAQEMLLEIKGCIEGIIEYQRKTEMPADEKKTFYNENYNKIVNLSNEYFHILPIKNYSVEACKPISSEVLVNSHLQAVDDLMNYDLIYKMMLGAMSRRNEINPADYMYKCLNCKLKLMEPEDSMSQQILKYINSQDKGIEIRGIYKVSRHGEDERLQHCKIENKHFLWHGSGTRNLLSILSRGLILPQSHRKGIFFADRFNKSRGYADKFLFLCEVKLGQSKHTNDREDIEKLGETSDFDSVVLNSHQNENKFKWFKLSSGVNILRYPEGRNYSFAEYIVSNPAQVCLRYFIQIK